MLDELDKELELCSEAENIISEGNSAQHGSTGLRFVRYADDIVIFVRSRKAGERVLESVTRFLRDRMKLQVNETKSSVEHPWDVKFLGFRITQMMGLTRLGIHPKALQRFKDPKRSADNFRRK